MELRLNSRNYFAGQFTIEDEHECFSIGDYLELTLLEPSYPFDEVEIAGRMRPIIRFPLRVEFSACPEEMFVNLNIPIGHTAKHWYECLEIGKTSIVTPLKMEWGRHVWYMPKIDGWRPGMFGRVKR